MGRRAQNRASSEQGTVRNNLLCNNEWPTGLSDLHTQIAPYNAAFNQDALCTLLGVFHKIVVLPNADLEIIKGTSVVHACNLTQIACNIAIKEEDMSLQLRLAAAECVRDVIEIFPNLFEGDNVGRFSELIIGMKNLM